MPITKRPLYGLKPWDGIRNPEQMPYLLKRGIASLIRRENKEADKAYSPIPSSNQFIKAYKIIGASLVRKNLIKSPNSVQGRLIVTVEGKQRERELKRSGSLKELERLKRARFALEYLDDVLVKLKEDLEAGVIQETS